MKRHPKQRRKAEPQTVSYTSRYRYGDYRLVRVFVEGYDDVAFWRGIFDGFETDLLKFEISVPPRLDLAKGKKVLMSMIPESNPDLLLCVDSDFDYLFDSHDEQSSQVIQSSFMFHTYAYATENYLCYPNSLHNICVKATKNDTMIFDFVEFMANYSRIIYPLFLWYSFSAYRKLVHTFPLSEFRTSVRLNFLDIKNNGTETLRWLERQVDKRLRLLELQNRHWIDDVAHFGKNLEQFGVDPTNTCLFMQGHTLMDNVVMVLLSTVCEKLREMTNAQIISGTKQGISLKNEISNYNNSLRNVREVLLDNEQYKECFLYKKLQQDIEHYLTEMQIR